MDSSILQAPYIDLKAAKGAIMQMHLDAGMREAYPVEKKPREYPASIMLVSYMDPSAFSTEEVEYDVSWRVSWIWDFTNPDDAQEDYERMLPVLLHEFASDPTLKGTAETAELTDAGSPELRPGDGVMIKRMSLDATFIREDS